MTRATVYRTSSDLVVRHVGDEAILVPVRHSVGDLDSVFTLNQVALRVWSLLDGRRGTGEIAEVISTEYDVEPSTAAADLAELLSTLEEAHLVEPVGSAS